MLAGRRVAERRLEVDDDRLAANTEHDDAEELPSPANSACQGHFYAAHPPPDPTSALALEDPAARLRAVLGGLYAWYREGRQLIAAVQRDRSLIPALDALLADNIDRQLAALGEALVAGWSPSDDAERRLGTTVAIALDFWTWQRMAELGLDDAQAAELMTDFAVCAAKVFRLSTTET